MSENLLGKRCIVSGYEDLGIGLVIDIDGNDEYSYYVEFDREDLLEDEKTGMFSLEQLNILD